MIRRVLLLSLFFVVGCAPARADRVWLVVGASDVSPAGIAQKAEALRPTFPGSLIVQTSDCGEKRNVFAWVAEISTSPEAAQAVLVRVRARISDAYVKPCTVQPASLLAFRISVIDPSIAAVPDDAVNWEDGDRVSSVRPLADGRALAIVRYFMNDPEDPLEGRRERVVLVATNGKSVTLEDPCVSPGAPAVERGRIAFHCVREQAGEHLLHRTLVFGAAGEKLAEIPSCRNPRWSGERVIVCESESVGPDGRLSLSEVHTEVKAKSAR